MSISLPAGSDTILWKMPSGDPAKLKGIAASLLAAATKPPVGDQLAFYNVAATVIPVFVLAGLYQANVVEALFDPSIRFAALVIFLIAALIGEVSALHVLSTGHPTHSAKSGVALGLEVSGGLLIMAPLAQAARRLVEDHKKLRENAVLFWVVFGGAIVLVGLAAYRAAERL